MTTLEAGSRSFHLIWADRLGIALFVLGAALTAFIVISHPDLKVSDAALLCAITPHDPSWCSQPQSSADYWQTTIHFWPAFLGWPFAVMIVGRLIDFLVTGRIRH